MFSLQTDRTALAFLLLAWVVAACFVNPLGDFPLNDDFAYGKSVKTLLETGSLRPDDWGAMTLVAQVIWGAAFCKVFGFSFVVLRFSTLILGFAGSAACYFIAREGGQSRRMALFVALLIAFNPFFFCLSFSFMTDVPFFALSAWAALFYCKALKIRQEDDLNGKIFLKKIGMFHVSGFWFLGRQQMQAFTASPETKNQKRETSQKISSRSKWIALGTFFALAATFVRQFGLLLPFAFGVAVLFRENLGGNLKLPPKFGFRPLLAALPFLISLAAFQIYLQTQDLPEHFGTPDSLFSRVFDKGVYEQMPLRTGILLAYSGFFLLPLSLLFLSKSMRPPLKIPIWLSAILAVVACVALAFAWQRLPWGNVLFNLGLGPKLLKDVWLHVNERPVLPDWALGLVKLSWCIGAVLLLRLFVPAVFFKLKKGHPQRLPAIFALTSAGLYIGILFLDKFFFDRYYFQLLPFLLICLLPGKAGTLENLGGNLKLPPKFGWLAAAIFILAIHAAFSIAATHDYLAWNRARWQALDFLTQEKNIPPSRMDGGFEFNAWHQPGKRDYSSGKSWWWVDKDDFVVAFGDLEGFEKVKGFAFQRWLPPGTDSIFVLDKN